MNYINQTPNLPNFSNLLDDLSSTSQTNTANTTALDGQMILEENSAFLPEPEEVKQYAENVLGIDLSTEPHLVKIAEEGIKAPLPHGWKPVQNQNANDKENELYYFNFETGESMWDHPCDELFREKVEEARVVYNKSKNSTKNPKNSKNQGKPTKLNKLTKKPSMTSSMDSNNSSLNPIRKGRGGFKTDENSEREFVRNLTERRSLEFEENNKIEPPPQKKPLISPNKQMMDDYNEDEPTVELSDYDSDFEIEKNDQVKPLKNTFELKNIMSNRSLDNSPFGRRSSKTVTFEDENAINKVNNSPPNDNPLANLISESSIDDWSELKNATKSPITNLGPTPKISNKSPQSSVVIKKAASSNDYNDENENNYNMTDSTDRYVKEQMADLEETLEKARQEYEEEKNSRISQQKKLLQLAEQKEAELIQNKLKTTENRNLEIETDLARLKLQHTKEKQLVIDTEISTFRKSIDLETERSKMVLETEKAEKSEKLKIKMEQALNEVEKEAKARFDKSVGAMEEKYETRLKSEEDRLKKEYLEGLERVKANAAQEAGLIAEQKDEMEQNLAKQMRNIEAQHARQIDQLTEQHTSERSKLIDENNRQKDNMLNDLDREIQQETDSKRLHLKRQQEFHLEKVRTKIHAENYEMEAKKDAIVECRERLDKEKDRFEVQAEEFRVKMEELEVGFAKRDRDQQKEIHEKLVDVMTEKEQLEICVTRLSTRKEGLARDIERLSLERAEMSENCSKMRLREAGIRHTLDVEEMGLERVRLDDVNIEQHKLGHHSYQENNTIDVLEKIAARKTTESPDSDVSDAENSVSGGNLEDTGEQLKLDFKGLRTTSTNKTNASLMNSDFNTQEVKMSVMQSKIDELETQLTSIRNSSNPLTAHQLSAHPLSAHQLSTHQLSSKPPLPNYQIPDTNSKFLPMDLSNSPYLKVEQQMNEKKAIYNNYYSQPTDQENELERKFKLEKFFKQQNDWWSDDLSQYNFGARSVSNDMADASAKELIRKRCELLREQRSSGKNSMVGSGVGGGHRSRHDSLSSLGNRVMSPNVGMQGLGAGVGSTPVKNY